MQDAPPGERRLHVELRPASPEGVVIRFSDTGEGISRENMSKIFSYGFTTKQNGNGFGLHTCANYVRQMGGSIAVDSRGPGRGAIFTILLESKPLKVDVQVVG